MERGGCQGFWKRCYDEQEAAKVRAAEVADELRRTLREFRATRFYDPAAFDVWSLAVVLFFLVSIEALAAKGNDFSFMTRLRKSNLLDQNRGPDGVPINARFWEFFGPTLKLSPELKNLLNAMLDVIAMALWTDSTRCISYMLGNSNSRMIFDFLGIKKQHHYLSHFFRNFSRENIDSLLKISLWHMEKFDYLLNKLKSYKDHNGRLLDHCVVLYGSGMGHSDNHTAQRLPIVLAGQGGGKLKTGRYLRYSKNQELGRLHLSLLELFGVKQESFANAKQPLPGLNGGKFDEYSERPFESWVKVDSGVMTVQGRLRMSDNLDEAKVFYIDVEGRDSVRMEIGFGDFHSRNVAYHVGTPIKLTGKTVEKNGLTILNKITALESLFGNSTPGKAGG